MLASSGFIRTRKRKTAGLQAWVFFLDWMSMKQPPWPAELPCGECNSVSEVYQCNKGHCYCVTCWRGLDPRRCPQCCQPTQDICRSRDRKARIAALGSTCQYCADATMRGDALAAHMRVCVGRSGESASAALVAPVEPVAPAPAAAPVAPVAPAAAPATSQVTALPVAYASWRLPGTGVLGWRAKTLRPTLQRDSRL